jgi:hypothetical protein
MLTKEQYAAVAKVFHDEGNGTFWRTAVRSMLEAIVSGIADVFQAGDPKFDRLYFCARYGFPLEGNNGAVG